MGNTNTSNYGTANNYASYTTTTNSEADRNKNIGNTSNTAAYSYSKPAEQASEQGVFKKKKEPVAY